MAESFKIAAVIDKSRAYNTYQRDKILTQWGVSTTHDKINSLSEVGGSTLFGTTPTVELHLQTTEQVKEACVFLEKHTPETLSETFANGLIITCEVARTSTKKLEAYFKKHGLLLIIPPNSKEGSLSEKLLSEIDLNPAVRKFILDYVGEEYETIISLVASLSTLPRKAHRLVGIEDILIRFPQNKGSLPAWDVEKHVIEGNVKLAIETARRVNNTTFWMAVLRNKMVTYHKVASVLSEQPNLSDDAIVKALNLPAKGFYFTKKTVKAHSLDTFEKAVNLTLTADANLKGGSSAPSTALAEELLVKLSRLFKK